MAQYLQGGAHEDPDVILLLEDIQKNFNQALDRLAAATPGSSQVTQALGKALIYDKSLSVNKNLACATCHVDYSGFTGPSSFFNGTTSAAPGTISIANAELDDLVIARGDGIPTYNFAVVVDDIDMAITHVLRGDDHVNNTPRQINIYRALGAEVPHFAHLPMILDEHGAKLSKRTGAADVMQYREMGYLPHALLNYLVRLGWSHGDQEVFSIEEMQSLFDLKNVNAKAARMDPAKLGWLNQQYLKNDDPQAVGRHLEWHLRQHGFDLVHGPKPADLVLAMRDRVQTLQEMAARSAVWFHPLTAYDDKAVAKHLTDAARTPLTDARARLAALDDWSVDAVSAALHATAETLGLGMGKVAQPLRVAITGTQVSPDIAHTVYLAGRDEALRRIDAALRMIPAEA